MNLEFLKLSGYGLFVWPAFTFSCLCMFTLYLKTARELKKQEKIFFSEFKQPYEAKISTPKESKIIKKALSGGII